MCKTDEGGFTTGLILGALIGGILGVLYAPDEGKKTRTKLKSALDEKSDAAREMVDTISEKVVEAKDKFHLKKSTQ